MLFTYQKEAVTAALADDRSALVEAPTGWGKSFAIAGIVRKALFRNRTARIVVIVDRKELLEQNRAALTRVMPVIQAGICCGTLQQHDWDAQILFATIQTVRRNPALLGHRDILIVDEAHKVPPKVQSGYRQVIAALGAINAALKLIGLTATPFRMDQGHLIGGPSSPFDTLVYSMGVEAAIREGIIVPPITPSVDDRDSAGATVPVRIKGADPFLELSAATKDRLARCLSDAIDRAMKRRSWLFFSSSVTQARFAMEFLKAQGIPAGWVTGKTPKRERDAILAAFKRGDLRALVNVDVLTTGFDVPEVDAVILLRRTASRSLYLQIVGRGLRPAEGKKDCLILDYAGNARRHGPLDAPFVERPSRGSGRQPHRLCDACGEANATRAKRCKHCGAILEERLTVKEPPSDEPLLTFATAETTPKPSALAKRRVAGHKARRAVSARRTMRAGRRTTDGIRRSLPAPYRPSALGQWLSQAGKGRRRTETRWPRRKARSAKS